MEQTKVTDYHRDARKTFVGAYMTAEDKRRLQDLAKRRRKTVTDVLIGLVREATTEEMQTQRR